MKLYLAGPMTGYPQFNYPAFFAAAEELRHQGYDIVSPAELDHDSEGDFVKALNSTTGQLEEVGIKRTWGDYLARDVKIVADIVQGVIFLPKWYESRGARLEAFVALLQKDHVFFDYCQESKSVTPVRRDEVLRLISRSF